VDEKNQRLLDKRKIGKLALTPRAIEATNPEAAENLRIGLRLQERLTTPRQSQRKRGGRRVGTEEVSFHPGFIELSK